MSAQLGYTVPFTLVHAGKYRTEDKLKMQKIHKLNTTEKKQTMQNTGKQNPGLVASYDTRPGNEMDWFYNAAEPTRSTYNPTIMSHKYQSIELLFHKYRMWTAGRGLRAVWTDLDFLLLFTDVLGGDCQWLRWTQVILQLVKTCR